MMKRFLLLGLGLPLWAWAESAEPVAEANFEEPAVQAVNFAENIANPPQDLADELRQNGELTRRMINRAIDTRQFALLPELLRIYRQTAAPDTLLIEYAEGIVLAQQGEYRAAVAVYRRILAEHPSFQPVRLRLAQMLFEDRQNEAALAQFRKLQAADLPPVVAQSVSQYIAAIQRRADWSLNFGVSYLHENNVNNASSEKVIQIGNVPFQKTPESLPQKANGVGYHFNAGKDWNVAGAHYLRLENAFNGKTYWNKHAFDDQQNRTYLGYQYQTAGLRAAVLPFYEQRWFANRRYHQSHGVRAEFEKWLTPNWQWTSSLETAAVRHRSENRRADSRSLFGSSTLLYAFNPKSYLYLGGDALRDHTVDAGLASRKFSARIGWGQEWLGVSSRLQVSYGKRTFRRPNVVFNKIRQDNELGINLTLWHRNVHFWGVTPKLNYQYQRVQSNLAALYSYQRQRIYLSFEKAF